MKTQTEIKKDIKDLESQILDMRNYWKHISNYKELEDKLKKMKDQYFQIITPKINELNTKIHEFNKELIEKKNERKLKLSNKTQEWFQKYENSVDWGYGGLKIVWVSENERWVIVTSKGSTSGTGTAMGTGGYYYSPAEHWIADTTKNDPLCNQLMKIEGRLTKEKKKEMIDYINSEIKTIKLE